MRAAKPAARRAAAIPGTSADIGDAAEVSRLLAAVRPDEIYNLASFSRPRDAIEQPVASSVVNALGPLHIFDFARCHLPACRIFQPSSSEIFGAAEQPVPRREHRPPSGQPLRHRQAVRP